MWRVVVVLRWQSHFQYARAPPKVVTIRIGTRCRFSHLAYLAASLHVRLESDPSKSGRAALLRLFEGFPAVARPDEGAIRAVGKQHLLHQQTGAAIINKEDFVLHSSCCRPGLLLRHSCGTAKHTRASAGAGTDGLTSAFPGRSRAQGTLGRWLAALAVLEIICFVSQSRHLLPSSRFA